MQPSGLTSILLATALAGIVGASDRISGAFESEMPLFSGVEQDVRLRLLRWFLGAISLGVGAAFDHRATTKSVGANRQAGLLTAKPTKR